MKKKLYSTKILKHAKKYKAVQELGGGCIKCGENDFLKLCFHHRENENKEFLINKLKEHSWEEIKKELIKCDLYCQNCHQELHDIIGEISNKRKNKKLYFEYIGESKCSICGYDKCFSSLNFHHNDDKKFMISFITSKIENISEFSEILQTELDKCVILCRNCHQYQHTDVKFVNEHIKEIIEKSINLKYLQSKIDREIVYDMYFNKKMKQIEISKFFMASKGTISGIIKQLKNNLA